MGWVYVFGFSFSIVDTFNLSLMGWDARRVLMFCDVSCRNRLPRTRPAYHSHPCAHPGPHRISSTTSDVDNQSLMWNPNEYEQYSTADTTLPDGAQPQQATQALSTG